jgi:multidrug efflux pump subunit AcrA (membrane-fusion protein)
MKCLIATARINRISLWLTFQIVIGMTVVGASGCSKKVAENAKAISDVPKVQTTKPVIRTIIRDVGQPSFIEAYEQTAIYAKLPAYLKKWNVDIGDRLKKGQELATLFIPELVEELEQKKAVVKQDESLVEQAKKLVAVAEANLRATEYLVKEARANVGRAQALVKRWESEVERLSTMVREQVVDKQVLSESERQLQSNQASLAATQAAVETASANQIAAQASLDKSRVDVQVASARLDVAKADADRLKALNGYLTLTAPYDGIVVLRNANTGDFVLPATGDPSAPPRTGDQSSAKATPIYVIARTDLVRIYVDVAESDAINIVCRVDKNAGDPRPVTKGNVRIFALDNRDFPAEATRGTWALNFKSRTLRTEIDLPNQGAKLLPGMYAYGMLRIERPNVTALPVQAVMEIGNQLGCYLVQDGKAVWTQVQTGVNDGKWIEVQQKGINSAWTPFTGSEEVVISGQINLSNGIKVETIKAEQ